jgi:chromosome segregation ATPase
VVEQLMYFAIGFLIASLFNLIFVPLVHNRAVRLTKRRLASETPFSMAEIQAEKDQLRAEFAMSTRRLEMSVDQLKAKTTAQLNELGKKSMAIEKLKNELNEKNAAILAVEARENVTREQLRTTEQEYSVKTSKMHDVEHAVTGKENELAKLTAALNQRTAAIDSQRLEIAALKTQVERYKAQLEEAAKDVKEFGPNMETARKAVEAATQELAQERSRAASASGRATQLERRLIAQTSEAEALAKRVQELEERLTEQSRELAEPDYDAQKTRGEIDRIEALKTEKAKLERERDEAREEAARLKREGTSRRQGAEAAWATERVENAMLRERINDIAAEVARLTLALEGPGSPIESILADEKTIGLPQATPGGNGNPPAQGDRTQASRGDLGERIRALQTRASRLSPAR